MSNQAKHKHGLFDIFHRNKKEAVSYQRKSENDKCIICEYYDSEKNKCKKCLTVNWDEEKCNEYIIASCFVFF